MCSPYFQRFPELPAELRLQIWQEACFAFPPSRRGLQYVTVQQNDFENEAVAIPCNWPSWPQSLSQNTNRSAYFLNGGLWKACKESREVIATYTEYYKWLEIHRQAIQDSRQLVRRQPGASSAELIRKLQDLRLGKTQISQPSSGHGSPPTIIDYHGEGREECRMLVYPSRDMFCIKVDDWGSICRERHPDIQIPLIRYNADVDKYAQLKEHEAYQALFKKQDLQDIALEFDPSWMTDIPHYVGDMADDNSARGYLANWLLENANPWLDKEGGLSIIDKEAKWFANGSVKTVYRDFDTEYVKVSWDDVADQRHERVNPSAYTFVQKIRHYVYDIHSMPESPGGWIGAWGPDVEDMIGLLVRRDNEVKEPIWSCRTQCDAMGWCICNNTKKVRRQHKEDPDAYLSHLAETVSIREWDHDNQDG